MFDDRKATGNPGRITCCGAQGESQQQFPDEAPGVEKIRLEKLVDQLRQQVQVHVVDAISYGMVPDSMLGWWVTPELASNFKIEQDIFIPNSVQLEAAEENN